MVAELNFLGQPACDDATLAAFLRRALGEESIDSLTLVVAWARFRGLVRLRGEIEAFRGRGGAAHLIVGIDEGGATRPGLLLAAELFDRAHVFHDPSGGTFHPKVYLAEGAERALLVVGSSNATPGGWFSNYEASLEARFELPGEVEAPALAGVREYISSLLAEDQLCFDLNEDLVDRLVSDPRYRIAGQERSRRSEATTPRREGEDLNLDASHSSNGQGGMQPVFGGRSTRRIFPPPLSDEQKRELALLEIPSEDESESGSELPSPAAGEVPSLEPTPVESWTKKLREGDAQQRPFPTKPTGNLRLTKSTYEIDWRVWFRNVMFGSETWRMNTDKKGPPEEIADVPFLVTIAGSIEGLVALEVSHAPHREAGQANVPTVLRWGALLEKLRATNYTDYMLKLERMSDGSFRLDISQ